MKKKYCLRLLLAGAAILFFIPHSAAFAADKVVVIPLSSKAKTTCTAPDEVKSAGNCWKDRDLGSSQVATYFDQWQAYGGLYQWGRPRDGHQHRFSGGTSNFRVQYDDPQHGAFILSNVTDNYDWRKPQNDNLWQGLGGTNNPCPQGFRLPTATEWEDEMDSWATKDLDGAFASLQLVAAGFRAYSSGTRTNEGDYGYYWSSTVDGVRARRLLVTDIAASFSSQPRANGYNIRCLKD